MQSLRIACGGMAAGLAALLPAPVAHARGDFTWLKPERAAVTPGAVLAIEVISGSRFGEPVEALTSPVVRDVAVRLGPWPLVVGAPNAAPPGLRYEVTLPRPGVAIVRGELQPAMLTIAPDQLERHLRELHASDDLRALLAELPPGQPWRELRTGRMKTFIRVGEPDPAEPTWTEPAPRGLDLVPERDPTALSNGDELAVRVYRNGRPAGAMLVAFLSQGETREHVVVTGLGGRAGARLDARGAWLVECMSVERERAGDHDWRTEAVELTVQAR